MIVDLNGIKVGTKLCNTPPSISEGMVGKKFNNSFTGMLFSMPFTGIHSFWTYKWIVALDIIFINKGIITKIYHNISPCTDMSRCIKYKGYGDTVLELEGGFCKKERIRQGHIASFDKSVARRANARSCTAVFSTS